MDILHCGIKWGQTDRKEGGWLITDILRDCRKSTKRAFLTILHIIKSTSYEHRKHKFMVFRQSLPRAHKLLTT
jgi:hypothetical protein